MINRWNTQEISIGKIREGKTITLTITPTITLPAIKEIRTTCGCTKASYNEITRVFTVIYKAGKIPNQVVGDQAIVQKISIFYVDGSIDELTLKGLKIREI